MMRTIPVILASLLMMACTASAQEIGGQTSPGDVQITVPLLVARAGVERGQPDLILSSLEPAMRDEVFAQLSKGKQYEVAELYSLAAEARGRSADLHRASVRATANPQATDEDWYRRLDSAVAIGDGADAYLTFKHLTDHKLPALTGFVGRQIDWFDALLGDLPNAREARLGLGREMEREGWEPAFVYDDPSLVWLHYAQTLIEAGDVEKAKAVAKRVKDPVVIMAMQADRRFDVIVATNPPLQDATLAAQNYLRDAQDYVRDNPRMISGRIALIRALAMLNRPQEAMTVIDDVVQGMAHAGASQTAFDDMEEVDVFEGWKDSVLISLGRSDEGIGGLSAVASCNCSALAVIELGRTFLEADRPQDAHRWVGDMGQDRLGLDDRMTLAQTQACVAVQRGDQAGVARALEFLRSHESWKPAARVGAMVCADQLDEAATVLAAQLADPRTRLAALGALQTYAADPHPLKYAAVLRARWAKLAAMPVVQAQVAKVGRINRYDLTPRGFIA